MSRDEPESANQQREAVERELKFPCDNLEGMRERLLAFEAERLAAGGAEENLVYDREGQLLEKREILRLRRDRSGWSLTFKGTPIFEDGVKVRSERETKVENGDEVHAILVGLGYEVVRRYEKKREEWRLGGVKVALDHTPIGDFIEFCNESVHAESTVSSDQPRAAVPGRLQNFFQRCHVAVGISVALCFAKAYSVDD